MGYRLVGYTQGKKSLCHLISVAYTSLSLFCQAGGREFKSRRSRTEKALVSREETEAFLLHIETALTD